MTLGIGTSRHLEGRLGVGALLCRVVIGAALVVTLVELATAVTNPLSFFRYWGGDYTLYMDATRRWLEGGSFYQPWQFQPYAISFTQGSIGATAILYPPYALALFVPFSFLPAVVWWAVPIATIAVCVRGARGWGLAALLVALALPGTWLIVTNGNPALWSAAFLVAATRYRPLGVFVLLKPTLAPFALVGIRSRGWWVGLGAIVALSLVLLPMTLDYVTVLRNATGPYATPLYSVATWLPMACLWFASRYLKTEKVLSPSNVAVAVFVTLAWMAIV